MICTKLIVSLREDNFTAKAIICTSLKTGQLFFWLTEQKLRVQSIHTHARARVRALFLSLYKSIF